MAEGIPVRQNLANAKVQTIGEMIRSYRLSKGLTQKRLAISIGSYVTVSGNTVISEYERGFSLPGIEHIYNLCEILGMDKQSFFEMVLRGHFRRFNIAHHKNFAEVVKITTKNAYRGEINFKKFENRYYFCTKGKIKYHFPRFYDIMQKCYIEKGTTFDKIAQSLARKKYIKHQYSRSYIQEVISGRKSPSLKVVIDLCDYFKIDTLEVYKIVVEEKAISHAKNMMEQWELYKTERANNGT